MQDFLEIDNKQDDDGTNVLKSLEAKENENLALDSYTCANLTDYSLDFLNMSPAKANSVDDEDIMCYSDDLPLRVSTTGFWYELCYEIQTSYEKCGNDTECLHDQYKYFSQMFYTQQIYLALRVQIAMRSKVFIWCSGHYEEPFAMDEQLFTDSLTTLDIKDIKNDKDWEYKPPENCFQINGEFSYDMDLFFKVSDMRQLYRWDTEIEFLAICELASGDFPECRRESFSDLDDFHVCVESKLAELDCFNYISEDFQARSILYNVCKYNKSLHLTDGDNVKDSNQTIIPDNDHLNFNERFGTFDEFNNLFE